MSFTRIEWAILFLTQALVLSLELVNTAIEATVDIVSPRHHPLAKLAKDVAAGAVLVAALGSVGVGLVLFLRPTLVALIEWILTTPWLFVLVVVGTVGLIWFILGFKEKNKINEF